MDKSNQKVVGLGGKLPVQDNDEFARRFGPSLSRGGIYLRTRQFVAPGTPVLLDLKRADGQALIRCRGKVEFVTGHGGEGTPGLGIRFLEMDAASRAVLDKALAGKPGAQEDAPPVPSGVGPLHYRIEPERPEPPAGATVLTAREVGELFHVGLPQGQWIPVAGPRREEPSQAATLAALRQELSFELKSLRRQSAWGVALAAVAVFAAFLGGRLSARESGVPAAPHVEQAHAAVAQAAPPLQQSPAAPVQAQQAAAPALAADDALADFEPAVEEELTAEEAARAREVLAATAPAPAPRRKTPPPPPRRREAPAAAPRAAEKVRPAPQPAARAAPSAALPLAAGDAAEAEVDPEEAQLVSDALAAPRGSACKERMGALTQLVARTRLLAHREAGIALRARCLSDAWKVDEARSEYRRYLREFPKGKYAAEASRVLAD